MPRLTCFRLKYFVLGRNIFCKIAGSVWINAKYQMPLNICQLFYVLQIYVLLWKYLPWRVTPIIIFWKLQYVGPKHEEIQVAAKCFLYLLYIHIKTIVKVRVSLICLLFMCHREKTSPFHELQFVRWCR